MNTVTAPKDWKKTRLNNMVRHASGRYYARLYLNGKEIWKSLKTSHFSIAEAKLAEVQREHRGHGESRGASATTGKAKMKFSQAAAIHMQRLQERVTIKARMKKYWRETLDVLLKSRKA